MDTNQTNGVPVAVEYRDGQEWVDARELHQALGVGRDFPTWFKDKIESISFKEGLDFSPKRGKSTGGRPAIEYTITVRMAEHLALMENNEVGTRIREYFINVEDAARALAMKLRELGGLDQVLADAGLARILLLFANRRSLDLRQVYHIIDLSLSKSSLTGDFIMAKDVARAVREPGLVGEMSESFVERVVPEIRRIVAETGRMPSIAREKNGNYKALPMGKEAADA